MKIKIKSLIISTSFLLVLFCFSSADSMKQADRDSIHEYFSNHGSPAQFSSAQWETIETYMNTCPYFLILEGSNSNNVCLFLFPFDSSVLEPWFFSGSSYVSFDYFGAILPYSLGNLSGTSAASAYTYYCFAIIDGGWDIGGCSCNIGSVDFGMSSWNRYWYYNNIGSLSNFSRSSFTISTNSNFSNQVYYTNFDCKVIESSYTNFHTYEQNIFNPDAMEDERLKLSHIFGLGGIDELLINMSEFYTETGASPTSGTTFSDVTLTVDYTDFQDQVTTQDIVLSSSNSTITHSDYPSTLIHLVETPYSVFGNFEDYSKIEIIGCSFSRDYAHLGASGPVNEIDNFIISCSFVLKAATASSDLEPEEIDLPDYEDPEVVSQSQIEQIRQQLQEDSTAPNPNSGDWSFVQAHPVVPSWADHYDFRVIYSDANSFVGNQVASNVWNYYTSNNPNGLNWLTSGFVPREFLYNNSAAMFYDMIIISVYEANVALAPDNLNILQYNNIELQGYLVFYSERYYIHRQALTQQDILSVLEYESYNDILYYTYVKDKLDDFENKTALGLSKLIGLQGSTNSWLSSLDFRLTGTNQQLGQILTAINNIDIPEAPDLGEITDSLEYLFIPSFSWSTINYNEYLDSLGILSMPFRFGSSVFSGLENGYSPNLEYHLYEAAVPLPASLGVSGNSFKLWDDQDFTLVTASIIPDQDLLANIRLFNLIICIMSQAFLTYLHIFRREGGVEDGI